MTLGLALENSLTGMRASQSALSVISHNIANANTQGYSRQIVQQSAQYTEGVGSGVKIEDVTRNIDRYLRRSILSQTSTFQRADTLTAYHDRIQVMLGQPGANNSLDESVTEFFTTLQQTAQTPESASFRSNAVNAGRGLANQVADLAFRLEDLRYQADQEIHQSVQTINDTVRRLDQVNVALASASVLNTSKAGLEDERDGMLATLSEYFDITTFFEESGAVNVFIGNGVALVDGVRREVRYSPVPSADNFANNTPLSQYELVTYDNSGRVAGTPMPLISAGTSDSVTTILNGGSLKGLQQIRDEIIPNILSQLDTLAAGIRDKINAIHNDGSAFPPPTSLTGTRLVAGNDSYNWSGSVRIAALKANGEPAPAAFTDESYTGFRPLTLNLAELNSGTGRGQPTMQSIIDEINNHFRSPPVKAKLGVFNNIQLVSNVANLPTSPTAQFTFDFDIENLTRQKGKMFVTNMTVLDNTATNITNITQNVPIFTANSLNTYTTTNGSNKVTVRLTLPPAQGVTVGEYIFLSQPPAGIYNGIPSTALGGYLKVTAVNGTDVTVEIPGQIANATGPLNQAGITMRPPYDTIAGGEKTRTRDAGLITADLTLNAVSPFYDISLDIGVIDEAGTISTTTITYRITNGQFNLLNDRYDNTAMVGGGERVLPATSQDALRAILVDANGNELPKDNGVYRTDEEGFLKIFSANGATRVAIDELDSKQLGVLGGTVAQPGSNRGFSHFFELNNFFKSNQPIATGDTLRGSAYMLEVEDRIVADPNLLSTGQLTLQSQSADPNAPPQYTYRRLIGDNAIVQRLANAGNENVLFAAAGGLPQSELSFVRYTGEMLGFIASQAVSAESEKTSTSILLDGFKERSEAVSNVNLDEELANTILYQNAYTASARIISVVDELFTDLLQTLS